MLHSDAVVDLVHADDVLLLKELSVGQSKVAIKVVDGTKTVASKTETVGSEATGCVADIESLLAVKRRSRITVGHCHLGHGQPVEKRPAIESEIVQCQTLARGPRDAELPSLPLDTLAVDSEGSAFWLLKDERLETCSWLEVVLEVRHVFALLHVALGPTLLPSVDHAVCRIASVAPVDACDFASDDIDDGNEWERPRVVKVVSIVGIVRRLEVHEELHQVGLIFKRVGAVDPWVGSDGSVCIKTKLLKSLLYQRILEELSLKLLELGDIEVGAVVAGDDVVRFELL